MRQQPLQTQKMSIKFREHWKVLTKNKTVVMIAHRVSTIKNADQIIVLKDGEIAERGKHNILVEKRESMQKCGKIIKLL